MNELDGVVAGGAARSVLLAVAGGLAMREAR
jgi:hypothetical protein